MKSRLLLVATATAAAIGGASPARAAEVDRWTAHMSDASQRFGIPSAWIRRVMVAESGGFLSWRGRPVRSGAGAMGLMQIMPATWAHLRSAYGLGNNPFDPHDNIMAGTAYLREMYDRFGYPGMFAAYNAGPARYRAYLRGRSSLPAETRAYVRQIAGPAWAAPTAVAAAPDSARGWRGLLGVAGQPRSSGGREGALSGRQLFAIAPACRC